MQSAVGYFHEQNPTRMGQGKSRDTAHVAPESLHPPIRKTGSLTSLTLGRMGHGRSRKGSLSGHIKRSRSFREDKELREAILRERIVTEGKEMERWVNERPKKYRQHVVPRLDDLAAVAVAKTLHSPIDVEGLPITRELKDAVEFRLSPAFDQTIADPKLSFTNGGRSAFYTGKGYSTMVMKTPFGRGLQHGRHAWIIHIDNSRVQGWIQLGVVDHERKQTNCRTIWDGHPHPFRKGEIARRNNGNFHSGKSELEATMVQETIYLGGFAPADTIAVRLDFDRKDLQWFKNGVEYGSHVGFEADTLYPSVSLDSPGEGVSLVYYAGPVAL